MQYPPDGEEKQKRDDDFEYYYKERPDSGDDYRKVSVVHSSPYERNRGGCLTAFLVYVIVANALLLMLIFSMLSQNDGSVSDTLILFSIVNQIFVVACAIGLWYWKRWGYYGMVAGYLLAISVNFLTGAVLGSFAGLIGLAILAGLMNGKHDMLE